jgi:hypothetical protein
MRTCPQAGFLNSCYRCRAADAAAPTAAGPAQNLPACQLDDLVLLDLKIMDHSAIWATGIETG